MYFASMYLVDLITHTIVVGVMIAIIYAFGLRIEGILVISLLFVIANPLFIYSIVIFMGLNRRKSSNITSGTLTGMISIFLLVINLTGVLWYS